MLRREVEMCIREWCVYRREELHVGEGERVRPWPRPVALVGKN